MFSASSTATDVQLCIPLGDDIPVLPNEIASLAWSVITGLGRHLFDKADLPVAIRWTIEHPIDGNFAGTIKIGAEHAQV